MIYEALPIPSSNGRNWAVYATFRHTRLPPKLELTTRLKAEAKRYAKEMCQEHATYPVTRYTWRWTRLDDQVNQWWKDNDDSFAKEHGYCNPYREGGRVIVIDFGDGEEISINR